MNRLYRGEWVDSLASRFVEELPEENISREEMKEQNNDDLFFNQDIDYEQGVRSPGWDRLQRKIKKITK
jgi:DNA helicase-2/ATP-dependent DNA helicase PcrA